MIKKIVDWYRGLSLSQQLFSIITIFITFFLFFFLFFINRNIDTYTKNQMYLRLNAKQEDIMLFHDKYGKVSYDKLIEDKDNNIKTIIVKDKNNNVSLSKSSELEKNEFEEIRNNILLLDEMNFTDTYIYNKGIELKLSSSDNYSYYIIRRINKKQYMVSMITKDYVESFKKGLISNIIDMTVFIVCGFFLVLMIWIATIIHPLNQIKAYIEKIKLGKKATLNINRQDEIGEVARALISMREELEKQEKTKEEMIHNISHDLKTPIATIKSYGESIKDGIYPYETLEKSVDVIINNAERLEKKVKSLLQLNRIEFILSQNREVRFCDMKDIVETVVLNTKAVRPDLDIECNLQTSLYNGNEEAWRVCIENILENAYRYAKTKITITLDDYQLCIFNDGENIPADKLRTLFKPYEKGEGGQFGLGLSIVHKVVIGNGYRIVVENVDTADNSGVMFMIKK